MPDGLDPADLYQDGRGGELASAVEKARPLLEHLITAEVARHGFTTPEEKARSVEAGARIIARLSNPVVRNDYIRFLSGKASVDHDVVEAALAGRPVRGLVTPDPERPLHPGERELFRAVLAEPYALDVSAADFQDDRLRSAFAAIEEQVKQSTPGVPIDPSRVPDEAMRSFVRGLALDPSPLPIPADIRRGLESRRIDAEIDAVEAELAGLPQGSESHSEKLRQLIALQQQKRSLGQ
jgi:DNA primase